MTNIEFYVTCADVKVRGTAEVPDSSFLAKVTPLSAFTGTSHLPADAGAYRKVTATDTQTLSYWERWDPPIC